MFLSTRSGLIAASAIVRIGGLNTRSTGNYHEIEYCIGNEPRETRASAEAVEQFLTEVQ